MTEAPSMSTFLSCSFSEVFFNNQESKRKLKQQATWADKESVITKEQYQPIAV